jgi:hypothetical protein
MSLHQPFAALFQQPRGTCPTPDGPGQAPETIHNSLFFIRTVAQPAFNARLGLKASSSD